MKLASKSSWKAKSFENIEVTLTASSTVKLTVIYRPPPSKRNKSTVGLFMTEFQDFLEHHTVKSQNILIVGDFKVSFHFGAFHFGEFHFDAIPVRRVSIWRASSSARFSLARFPILCQPTMIQYLRTPVSRGLFHQL